MGRRAKNKQGDPASLDTSKENSKPPQKKLGKRKAEPEADEGRRPSKKAKETEGTNKKAKSILKPGKGGEKVGEGGGKKGKSKSAAADLWEDVDDDANLRAQAKCAQASVVLTFC